VGDARLRELVAERESGLTRADNDDLDPLGHRPAILGGVREAELF
jgi:hypothetical protein